ncbi:hypothetical protein [Endozoicomonas acroporae]|uniref:hypothetical protein n=1 Tax=Endozoicomonas acroporae TaxID=1701104 RepID=UPI003D7A69DC
MKIRAVIKSLLMVSLILTSNLYASSEKDPDNFITLSDMKNLTCEQMGSKKSIRIVSILTALSPEMGFILELKDEYWTKKFSEESRKRFLEMCKYVPEYRAATAIMLSNQLAYEKLMEEPSANLEMNIEAEEMRESMFRVELITMQNGTAYSRKVLVQDCVTEVLEAQGKLISAREGVEVMKVRCLKPSIAEELQLIDFGKRHQRGVRHLSEWERVR